MHFSTDRLHLRDVVESDLNAVHELLSLPETDEFNTLGIPENIEVSKNILEGILTGRNQEPPLNYVFYIEELETKSFIGLIAFYIGKPKYKTAEISYKIHVKHWGKGYATEAAKKILEFGFDTLELHRITAGCAFGNIASNRVLKKIGMTQEGIHKQLLPIRGEWIDGLSFAILKKEYLP